MSLLGSPPPGALYPDSHSCRRQVGYRARDISGRRAGGLEGGRGNWIAQGPS